MCESANKVPFRRERPSRRSAGATPTWRHLGVLTSSGGDAGPARKPSFRERRTARSRTESSIIRGVKTPGGVAVDVDGGVAVITIDRPEVRNAIGFATTDELS